MATTWIGTGRFPAAGGGITITEDFNTADTMTLGPDLTWTDTSGDMQVVSGQAKSSGAFSEDRAEHNLTGTNHYCQAKIYKNGASAAGDNSRVLVRFDSSARTHYGISARADNTYDLFKRTAGTFASLQTGSMTWANGDTLRLEVSGTDLTVKLNGATVTTLSDSAISTGQRCGISIANTTCSIDDFEAGDL